MANNTTAVATLRPLEGNVVDLLTNFENQDNIAQRQKQIRQANKAQLDAKIKAAKDKELKEIKFPEQETTKIQTLDEYGARAVSLAADNLNDAIEKLSNPNISKEEEQFQKARVRKIQMFPQDLAAGSVEYTKMYDEYNTTVQGKRMYRMNPKYENFINGGASGWSPHFSPNGDFMTAFMDKDVNQDGEINQLDVVKYGDLQSRTGKFAFDLAFDRQEIAKKDIANIKAQVNTTDDGTTKVTRTTVDPLILRNQATTTLLKDDGDVTPIGNDFAFNKGIPLTVKDKDGVEVPNIEGFKIMRDEYANELKKGISTGVVVDKNNEMLKYYDAKGQATNDKRNAATVEFRGVASYMTDLVDQFGFERKKGERAISATTSGIGNKTGSKQKLLQVVQQRDGSYNYDFEIFDITKQVRTPESLAKKKEDPNYDFKDDDWTQLKSVNREYNSKKEAMDAQNIIVNMINTETGTYFKNLKEANDLVGRKISVWKSSYDKTKEKANTTGEVNAQQKEVVRDADYGILDN